MNLFEKLVSKHNNGTPGQLAGEGRAAVDPAEAGEAYVGRSELLLPTLPESMEPSEARDHFVSRGWTFSG